MDAGWRLVEEMTLGQLFASLTATDVAREAGRTTGAFFHHFETFDEYVVAMVDAFAAQVDPSALEVSSEELDHIADLGDIATGMRDLMRSIWEVAVGTHVQRSELARLMLLTAVDDSTPRSDGTVQADLVRRVLWDVRVDAMGANVERMWEALHREPLEPFDPRSTALVMNAALIGLRLAERVGVDVHPDLVAELGPVLSAATSRPKGAWLARAARDAELEPPGPVDAAFDPLAPGADDVLRAIRGVIPADGAEPGMGAVAAAVGVSVCQATAWFGSARRAAALTARLDVPLMRERSSRFIDTDPARAVADALVAIVRAARAWGPVATALLGERAQPHFGDQAVPGGDIREVVPLGDLVLEPLMATWGCAECRPFQDDAELAVDLALQVGASRPRMAPADVADVVLRAVTSLRGPAGQPGGGR